MVQADATMNRLPAISRFAALCLLAIFVVCGGYGLNTLLAPYLIRAAGDHLSIAQVAPRRCLWCQAWIVSGSSSSSRTSMRPGGA